MLSIGRAVGRGFDAMRVPSACRHSANEPDEVPTVLLPVAL